MNPIARRICLAIAMSCLASLARAHAAPPANPVVVGTTARFTVVTANCIRIEYVPDGKFVDQPSTFAANRATRFMNFKLDTPR